MLQELVIKPLSNICRTMKSNLIHLTRQSSIQRLARLGRRSGTIRPCRHFHLQLLWKLDEAPFVGQSEGYMMSYHEFGAIGHFIMESIAGIECIE
ncbi:Transcriptional activator hap5 [Fusarium oxysporum f. sp. albedinis]|nr:Transcriptional activator hap5 [Fusarium oxysporum f. sp. albedinis]